VTASDGDRDGTPSVLGESIAAGVPVIASRLAGLAEFIIDGETGLLHDPGDIEGLRACVLALMDAPASAERLALEAAARFLPQLDKEHVAARYASWYREAISTPEAASA
jgi:glycosyltransferase involved in cell wall biosynthesis